MGDHYRHTTILIWSGSGELTPAGAHWSDGSRAGLWLALPFSQLFWSDISPGQPDAAQTRLAAHHLKSLSSNFRHNNLLIPRLFPRPRTACVAPEWSASHSRSQHNPGTGLLLYSLLPSVSVSALSPGSHFTGFLQDCDRDALMTWHCVTLQRLGAWHVMTPRQRGNEVKIGRIILCVLRMGVLSRLPTFIRCFIVSHA